MSDPPLNNDSAATTIAAMAVEDAVEAAVTMAGRTAGAARVAGRAGGILVQPAVWVATGTTPDGLDMVLYGVGAVATAVGSAVVGATAGVVGIAREMVNDEVDQLLAVARLAEPKRCRRFIQPTSRYSGASGPATNAGRIAARGGTAWQHRNGLWVYITDANGRMICDYEPANCLQIRRPILPLARSGNGFSTTTRRRR